MDRIRASSRNRIAPHPSMNSRIILLAVGVGLVSFLVTELMHYMLVPDLGRRWERLLAEAVSGIVVAMLTAKFMEVENQRQESALLRMQVISEMNHHVRNALAAITLSTNTIQNRQSIRVISQSVDRIEWTLREILLRAKPVDDKDRNRLGYFLPSVREVDTK